MRLISLLLVFCLLFTPLCFAQWINDPSGRAQKVFIIAPNLQVRIDYSGSNPIYVGYADKGVATTSLAWFIIKITWTGSTPTLIQTYNNGAWDSRTGYTYS